jgi:ribosome-binding ATPase YchF (GTP1/OBG family)
MRIGIIGLPGSGKTTVFNALTRGSAESGSFGGNRSANIGVAHVPDDRLDRLTDIFKPSVNFSVSMHCFMWSERLTIHLFHMF